MTPVPAPNVYTAELTVERYLGGVRIDSFLSRHFRNYTPFRMQRMIRAGNASINGIVVELDTRVFPGQQVRLRLVEPPDKLLEPECLPLDVLYEDPWLIAVNKPADQISHPVGVYQSGTLCNALQHHFDRQTALPGLLRPGIVHRIDRMTSGVLVVAKEHLAHRRLSIGFQQGRCAKEYLAIVEGRIADDEFSIDSPIGRVPGGRSILMSASPDARDPRPASTRIRVLNRFEDCTFVSAAPKTGRNHQIRVHLASIGHPILGDEYYGPFGEIRKLPRSATSESLDGESCDTCEEVDSMPGGVEGEFAINRHALHAHRLEFVHPVMRMRISIEAPLAADMRRAIEQLSCSAKNIERTR
jgi:23S rRNA pseudouridine1911/1915/1917 synthase